MKKHPLLIGIFVVIGLAVLLIWGVGWRVECDTRSGQVRTVHTCCLVPFAITAPEATLLSDWSGPPTGEKPNWIKVKSAGPPGACVLYCFDQLLAKLKYFSLIPADEFPLDESTKSAIARYILDELQHGEGICQVSRNVYKTIDKMEEAYIEGRRFSAEEIIELLHVAASRKRAGSPAPF